MEYSDIVQRHFAQPVNAGPPDWDPDIHGAAGSVSSGLAMRFWLALDGDRICRAAFAAYGCPHAIATASWVTERLVGQRLENACRLDLPTIAEALDLPPPKWRCVLVAEDALAACLETD